MSMRSLELEILRELRLVSKQPRLRLRDILEWRSGPIEKRDDKTVYFLPKVGVNAAIRGATPLSIKPKSTPSRGGAR